MSRTLASLFSWSYVSQNESTILDALLQHLGLTVIAVGAGFAISLPLGVLIWRFRRARWPVLGVAGVLYTVPSLALFALLQPVLGYFTLSAAEVALTSYTLLILLRNVVAGLDAVPAEVREAARAMGYTATRELWAVDLPLALPAILAGLRVATVTVVGLVTVTAFIGEGGLGKLITDGFTNFQTSPIVVALVLSIALAALGDLLFVLAERLLVRWRRGEVAR